MYKKSGAYENGKSEGQQVWGEKKKWVFCKPIQIDMLSELLSGDEKVRSLVFRVDVSAKDKRLRNYWQIDFI